MLPESHTVELTEEVEKEKKEKQSAEITQRKY